MDFTAMVEAFKGAVRDAIDTVDPYRRLREDVGNAVEGRDMYGQWNNHAWSLYYAELRDGVVHTVYDPRCPWCTQRKSTGHYVTCDRPQGRGR